MGGFILFLRGLWAGGRKMARSMSALAWACITAALLLVLLLATCSQHSIQDARRETREAEKQTREVQRGAEANDEAAVARMSDVKIIYNREKERTDALSSLPDGQPSARRIALACQRLRQQSTPDRGLPVVCRSGG